MGLSPKHGVELLLIAPGYDATRALRCDDHRAMSGVFARQVLWASGRPMSHWREECRRLFLEDGHPCCVIDYENQGRDEASRIDATSDRVGRLSPQHVALLGREVEHLAPRLESLSAGRFVIHVLGFPRMERWKSNARQMREMAHRDLLSALASSGGHDP